MRAECRMLSRVACVSSPTRRRCSCCLATRHVHMTSARSLARKQQGTRKENRSAYSTKDILCRGSWELEEQGVKKVKLGDVNPYRMPNAPRIPLPKASTRASLAPGQASGLDTLKRQTGTRQRFSGTRTSSAARRLRSLQVQTSIQTTQTSTQTLQTSTHA
jgi:hypothetical protein